MPQRVPLNANERQRGRAAAALPPKLEKRSGNGGAGVRPLAPTGDTQPRTRRRAVEEKRREKRREVEEKKSQKCGQKSGGKKRGRFQPPEGSTEPEN